MDRQMDGQVYGWTGIWMDRYTVDGWIYGQVDGWTDRQVDECTD